MTQEPRPTPELLPCPFCGGHASLCLNHWEPSYVSCNTCTYDGPLGNRDTAAELWNARTARTLTPEQVERARKLIRNYDRHVYRESAVAGWPIAIEFLREVVGDE